jgi:hypothetical protein
LRTFSGSCSSSTAVAWDTLKSSGNFDIVVNNIIRMNAFVG